MRAWALLGGGLAPLSAVVFENQSAIARQAVGAILAAMAAVPAHHGRADDLRTATITEVDAVDLRHVRLLGALSAAPSLPRFFPV
jgi:hypothetical protein